MTEFWRLVRAEWTKLRSVRRWVLGLLAAAGLTLALSVFTAAGSGTNLNDHPEALGPVGPAGERVQDEFTMLHQPLTGDGSLTARVAELAGDPSGNGSRHEWAKAGIMVRESLEPGSRYVAVLVTPEHGVRLQANYTTDRAGSDSRAPRWLRLTRTGDTISGSESPDGISWNELGTIDLAGLPAAVEVGLFATSPDRLEVETSIGGSSSGTVPTFITGAFDGVRMEPGPVAPWREYDTSGGFDGGETSAADGVLTVTGSGDIGPYRPDDDVTQLSLMGVIFGQIAMIAVGVLFITSEYRRGMIRTTFAANPRRGRVLVAKAVVLGAATFVVGLVASLTAFLVTLPVLRSSGFGPPAYPSPSLTEGPVLRAVVGAAVFLALVAVLSLGVGAILRRSVGAITAVVAALIPATILVGALPLTAAQWVMRTTPAAGLSILQSIPIDHDTTVEPWSMAPPLAGLGVLAAYAAVALAGAVWLVRRRDA